MTNYKVNEIVKVIVPQNNYSNMFILKIITIDVATQSKNGLQSYQDKIKSDSYSNIQTIFTPTILIGGVTPTFGYNTSSGYYSVNGKVVKPSYEVKVGDIIEIQFGDKVSKFEIIEIPKVQGRNMGELIKIL